MMRGTKMATLFLLLGLGLTLGCGKKSKDNPDNKDGGGEGVDPKPAQAEVGVSGKIDFKGTKVAGMVIFVAADGTELPPSPINEAGTYYVDAPPPGSYKVVVRSLTLPGGGVAPLATSPDSVKLPGGGGAQAVPPPRKYTDVKTTDLTFEVKGGEQTFDIALKP